MSNKDAGGQIHKQLAAIMEDVEAVGKDQENKQQGFKYRGINQVVDMLHPIMAKHKVFVLPEILEDRTEERTTSRGNTLIYRVLKVRIDFVSGVDGSTRSSVVMGEGMDSGDKASNKAMTAALKYCFSQTFVLPYGLVDGDAATPEPSTPKTGKTHEAQPAETKGSDADPQAQLVERMSADGVSNIMLLKYCRGKGWLKDGQNLMDLPGQLVDAMLVPENWAKVLSAVKMAAPKPDDDNHKLVGAQADAFHAGLYDLMDMSGVTRDELKKYLLGKKYITSTQTIDNLPEKFVEAMTTDENWDKVVNAIKKERK